MILRLWPRQPRQTNIGLIPRDSLHVGICAAVSPQHPVVGPDEIHALHVSIGAVVFTADRPGPLVMTAVATAKAPRDPGPEERPWTARGPVPAR